MLLRAGGDRCATCVGLTHLAREPPPLSMCNTRQALACTLPVSTYLQQLEDRWVYPVWDLWEKSYALSQFGKECIRRISSDYQRSYHTS